MRVIFHVRCHGEPDEILEREIMNRLCVAVEVPAKDWGILTIGRSYYHDNPECSGHPDAADPCDVPDAERSGMTPLAPESEVQRTERRTVHDAGPCWCGRTHDATGALALNLTDRHGKHL